MKLITQLPQPIRDELRRLDERLVQALLAKDEVSIITLRLLWAETYLRATHSHRVTLPHLTAAVDDAMRPVFTARERWRPEKRARPLIAVVAREQITWADPSGFEHSYYRDTLACGHVNQFAIFWEDEKPARRRRCKECGRAIVAALPQCQASLPANVVMMPARAVGA